LGGRPDMIVMRKTVMFNMVEMPSVIFSPDSAGIRNTNLEQEENKIFQGVSDDFILFPVISDDFANISG
jgi:hypothetical protein